MSKITAPPPSTYWGPPIKEATTEEETEIKRQWAAVRAAMDKAAEIKRYQRECEAKWVDSLLSYLFKEYDAVQFTGIVSKHR